MTDNGVDQIGSEQHLDRANGFCQNSTWNKRNVATLEVPLDMVTGEMDSKSCLLWHLAGSQQRYDTYQI